MSERDKMEAERDYLMVKLKEEEEKAERLVHFMLETYKRENQIDK